LATKGLFIEMDGRFPNHHPDPTVEENLVDLRREVLSTGADCGVAYDGDGDRIGVIDEKGEVIWGDRLLILLARDILRDHPGTPIVGEVKCSQTLFDDIAAHGGKPVMSAVGHSIIKERMKKEGALLAGEMSGHIFFAHRWFGFDDAIYTTMRLMEILSGTEKKLSELLADVPKTHVTPEIRLDCPDDRKFALVEEAIAHFKATHEVIDIDGARIQFGHGWGLILASNTQPVLVLRAEAETADGLQSIRDELESFVALRS
jgi:phosphomannomutase/phosphoglucomutase